MQLRFCALALLKLGALSAVQCQPTVKLVNTFRMPAAPTGMSINAHDRLAYVLAAASAGNQVIYVYSVGGLQKCTISIRSNFSEINGLAIEGSEAYLAVVTCTNAGCGGYLCVSTHPSARDYTPPRHTQRSARQS